MTLEEQLGSILKTLKNTIANIKEIENTVNSRAGDVNTVSTDVQTKAEEMKKYVDTMNSSINTLNTLEQQITDMKSTITSTTDRAEKMLKETQAIRDTLTDALVWKGSVDNYAALPTENVKVGDTYNITAADSAYGINAGDNVVWDGTKWDSMGGIMNVDSLAVNGQDANFKEVTATTFHGTLNGKADSATTADVAKTVAWDSIGGKPANFVDTDSVQTITGTKTFTNTTNITTASDDTYLIPLAVQAPNMSPGHVIYINLGKEGSSYNRYSFGFHYQGNNSPDNYFSFSSFAGPSYNFDCAGNATFPLSLTAPKINAGTSVWTGSLTVTGGSSVPTAATDDSSHTIASTEFVSNVAPKKDGTGATGTWDISVSGNAATATKATADGNGNNIANTYATKTEVAAKQDKLTFDTEPTENSKNPVTSDGIKKALDSISSSNTNQLQRNKEYKVGDIAYSTNLPSWAYLECVTAGTTGDTEPDFSSIGNDGSGTSDTGTTDTSTDSTGGTSSDTTTDTSTDNSGTTNTGSGRTAHPKAEYRTTPEAPV